MRGRKKKNFPIVNLNSFFSHVSDDIMLLTTRRLTFLLLLVIVPSIFGASTRSRSKKKTKDAKEKPVNICDIEEQGSPLFCYCDSNQLGNATDANCWIFGKLEPEVPIWNHFNSQSHIKKLTLTVRPVGSFSHIPTGVLKQLTDVEVVTIQYATISVLKERAFSNISTILEINLSRNGLVNMSRLAFENMRNLTHLNLDENRIGEINRDVFVGLPSLKKLFINKNNVTVVHDKAFRHLASLEELELSGNEISVVTRDTFNGLRNLLRLDLRANRLAMIGERTFAEMPALEEMDLDQNQIEFISEKALDGMRGLRKLRLSENKLVTLESDFLAGAPNVYLLDLRDNQLKTMTFDNIKPIVTNLYNSSSYFYLDGKCSDKSKARVGGMKKLSEGKAYQDHLNDLPPMLPFYCRQGFSLCVYLPTPLLVGCKLGLGQNLRLDATV